MSRIQIRSASQNNAHIGTKIPVPTVTGVSPSSGGAAGGDSVTITGTHFMGEGIVVLFDSNPATSVVVTNFTQIIVDTPAHAAGVVNVVVTTIGGSGIATSAFTYI